ncbi:response regulator [Chitinophaga varians]|uniref:response regulator n=1 Tax=Chitinophaga varians TaxID=2202339 RepID=UPI00165F1D41|nr:response regulator transcription factor [Chitinophaga varians]MBC9913416.1 response regulator transcription factor [Chitinophaga varians]
MPAEIVNVALFDSAVLFRRILRNYLCDQKGVNVIAHASALPELFDKLDAFTTDILIIDIFKHPLDGLQILKTIRVRYPELRILVMSDTTDIHLISDLLDLGIYGFIAKTDEPEDLLLAIVTISNNRIFCSKLLTEALYRNKLRDISTQRHTIILSEREQQVLQLLWEEKSNKEIADELYLSIRSIEKIRQDMKEKLGVKSIVGLLKYGIHQKIILPANIADTMFMTSINNSMPVM